MGVRFSLAPPQTGDDNFKGIDILGVPSLEWIKKFSQGDVGVAQSCFDSFFNKTTAGLDGEVLDIFSDLAKSNNELPSMGLPALESTLIKSVFETQKPFIDAILSVLNGLTTLEDIIAVLKGSTNKASLKPKTNRKSLYTKLNGIKSELKEIQRNTKPAYSSFANFSFAQKITGINTEDLLKQYKNKPRTVQENTIAFYDWVTVSTFYSTGEFIENVPYIYTYIDIIDDKPDLSAPPFEVPESRNDDNPPTIIFDMLVDKDAKNHFTRINDINLLPNDWDISTKWFGEWDGWTKNENGFINEYTKYTDQLLNDEFNRAEITNKDLKTHIRTIFKQALPPKSELYTQYIAGNFKEAIYKEINIDHRNNTKKYAKITDTTENGSKINAQYNKEKIGDFWHNQKDKFGYKPRKINGNWIDPEVDYHLRLVRIFPENSRIKPSSIPVSDVSRTLRPNNVDELSGSNPLVFSYGTEILIDEVLHKSDYLVDSNLPQQYTPNGYTVSKTERTYPKSEKVFDRDIIDKLRKSNTNITEKIVVGNFSIITDFKDVFKNIELQYTANTLDMGLKKDIDTLFTYDNSIKESALIIIINRVTDNIIDLISDKISKRVLEAIGNNKLRLRIQSAFLTIRKDLEKLATDNAKNKTNISTNPNVSIESEYKIPLSSTFDDLILALGDIENLSKFDIGERSILNEIVEPESLYGEYRTEDIWNNRTSNGLGSIFNILNNTLNNNNKPGRIKNGDKLDKLTYVGDGLIPAINPGKGVTLNETKFIDTGIFYIVEGVYKNRKDFINDEFDLSRVTTGSPNGANSGIGNESFYKFGKLPIRPIRSLAAATSKFAQFSATTLPAIINKTTQAISILKNPFNLIFEIIFEQLSDTFEAFDPQISEKFAKLKEIADNEGKRQFIQNDPTLRNFIALDQEYNYRFIFDGLGVISIFGFNFGLGIKDLLPNMILENNGLGALFCTEEPPDRGGDNSGNYDVNGNLINNIDANGNPLNGGKGGDGAANRLVDNTTYELISTEYSTGDFIEGIDYQYYYITLDNQALVNKATSDLDKASKIFDEGEKIRLKLLALEGFQQALAKDPGNVFLNKQLNDVIKQNGVQVNMIFQFLISIILIPIKIVICIIEYIVDFFTNLKVTELPTKIPEFLGFNWILEFFKPTKVLALLGIELNPDFSPLWLVQSLVSDPSFKFDVSKIFAAPFLGRMPVYSSLEYPNIVKGGPKMLLTMGGVFCFLENIINQILCFIFNLFNLEKLFDCPEINLSRFISDTLSNEDINKLLADADYNFLNQTSVLNNNETAFVYDVTLDNGEIVKDLNRSELQAFVASNRNLRYKYNFDGIT